MDQCALHLRLFCLLTPEDDKLLEDIEKTTFRYFVEQVNPTTGLVKDRANVRSKENNTVASIAATGFGLTALCIGNQRNYITLPDARIRAQDALRFLLKKVPTIAGSFITTRT